MYLPSHFAEDRLDVLTAFIRDHPFATLVSPFPDGLFASHLPMLWDPEPAPFGTLTGHVARPNPHGTTPPSTADSLAIFLGPQAYVSPSWYPAKTEHGKVVPTWNYVAVHARGPLRTIDDPAWLRTFVTRLTNAQERTFARPWHVTDAPEPFVEAMLRGIVGVEMPLRALEGKWKLSQNRPAPVVDGTIAGLEARGDSDSAAVAAAMAVRRRERDGA
jgi:transcriptional regulator